VGSREVADDSEQGRVSFPVGIRTPDRASSTLVTTPTKLLSVLTNEEIRRYGIRTPDRACSTLVTTPTKLLRVLTNEERRRYIRNDNKKKNK
jgi:transcriptional regulator of met regulon